MRLIMQFSPEVAKPDGFGGVDVDLTKAEQLGLFGGKGKVKQHQRVSKSGKISQVKQHQRAGKPTAPTEKGQETQDTLYEAMRRVGEHGIEVTSNVRGSWTFESKAGGRASCELRDGRCDLRIEGQKPQPGLTAAQARDALMDWGGGGNLGWTPSSLRKMLKEGPVTADELAQKLGGKAHQHASRLEDLVEQGVLRPSAPSGAGRYKYHLAKASVRFTVCPERFPLVTLAKGARTSAALAMSSTNFDTNFIVGTTTVRFRAQAGQIPWLTVEGITPLPYHVLVGSLRKAQEIAPDVVEALREGRAWDRGMFRAEGQLATSVLAKAFTRDPNYHAPGGMKPKGHGWEPIPGSRSAKRGWRRKGKDGKWEHWYPDFKKKPENAKEVAQQLAQQLDDLAGKGFERVKSAAAHTFHEFPHAAKILKQAVTGGGVSKKDAKVLVSVGITLGHVVAALATKGLAPAAATLAKKLLTHTVAEAVHSYVTTAYMGSAAVSLGSKALDLVKAETGQMPAEQQKFTKGVVEAIAAAMRKK